jgi:hypothetical protein
VLVEERRHDGDGDDLACARHDSRDFFVLHGDLGGGRRSQ